MSEPTLRPTWTPEDAAQTELDATGHTPSASVTGEPDPNPDMLPFRRPAGSTCECCGARPEESCETGCLNLMTDDEQRAHRDEVIDNALAELADVIGVDTPAPMPDEYLAQVALYAAEYVGRRRAPRRASHFAKMTLAVVVLVLVLVVGALWAATRANALGANCQQQIWQYGGLLGRMTTRTLCDGPVRADGSWVRQRNFHAAAYDVPVSCSWGRYGGGCSGGYRKAEFDTGVDQYVVTPETVLADEPGHLG